jgi:hypothetical protein
MNNKKFYITADGGIAVPNAQGVDSPTAVKALADWRKAGNLQPVIVTDETGKTVASGTP